MKLELVEIKDVRIGQIYKGKENYFVIKKNITTKDYMPEFEADKYQGLNFKKNTALIMDNCNIIGCENDFEDKKIIGFLDKTHKIEDNKLIEIPRKEFDVGDIYLQSWHEQLSTDCRCGIISDSRELILSKIDGDTLIFNNCLNMTEVITFKKEDMQYACLCNIGTYSITHEFKLVNE